MLELKYGVKLQRNQYFPLMLGKSDEVNHGDFILVRTDKGEEFCKVERIPLEVVEAWGNKIPEPVPILRKADEADFAKQKEIKEREREAFIKCLEMVEKHKLPMRLVDCAFTFDQKRLTFFFTATERVDFRNLLRDLTQVFRRTRIDLRHIGVRDETAIIDGLGICGRQYCCSSFLKQFKSVNLKLAKDQGLPLNPSKISGNCGRLLCCLNYEYPVYLDAAVGMPPVGCGVMTPEGIGRVCSLHFLNATAMVKLEDGRICEFKKHEIEMIDDEVSGIDIDTTSITNYSSQQIDEDTDIVDLSTLEDSDDEYTE